MPVIVVQHERPHTQPRRRTGGCHQRDQRGKLVPERVADEMVADQQGGIAALLDLTGFVHPGPLRVHLLTEDTKTKGSWFHRHLLLGLFVHLIIPAGVQKALRFLLLNLFPAIVSGRRCQCGARTARVASVRTSLWIKRMSPLQSEAEAGRAACHRRAPNSTQPIRVRASFSLCPSFSSHAFAHRVGFPTRQSCRGYTTRDEQGIFRRDAQRV